MVKDYRKAVIANQNLNSRILHETERVPVNGGCDGTGWGGVLVRRRGGRDDEITSPALNSSQIRTCCARGCGQKW